MKDKLKLYFVCGTSDCPDGNILEVVEQALEAGITLFQFREKGTNSLVGPAKLRLASQLQALCRNYHVPFIIDDDIELALKLDADGIHIGQTDVSVKEARVLLPSKIIGLSVSTMDEYCASNIELVDYIGVGPFRPTQSKEDAKPPIGNTTTKAIRKFNQTHPIVAIGGITSDVVPEIIQAGADGIAVISAISKSPVPKDATTELKVVIEQALSLR
ncbi:thiamine phosphate synthase [Streptococcus dysgalactiae]|uniref:Thiamine-phosphate synthase n=1 Tax=Streptococcus dysgalactiae TaxID=1334 RepID=A0AAE9UKS6_STRDY|nr:thiamine phosphate synthase [Streptococcus dysgalactiae]QGH03130.1 thiamine phosphate synthase [Streptococcus dysgalactiae subsp. dysgalactiae]WAI92320.1 thiamine phosphate synthase [Streptococcus dysgalactiae]